MKNISLDSVHYYIRFKSPQQQEVSGGQCQGDGSNDIKV